MIKVVRPDKEEVIYYSDRSLQLPVAEEFRALWHRVSVDGLTEADIDKYLQSIGLGAMQVGLGQVDMSLSCGEV